VHVTLLLSSHGGTALGWKAQTIGYQEKLSLGKKDEEVTNEF